MVGAGRQEPKWALLMAVSVGAVKPCRQAPLHMECTAFGLETPLLGFSAEEIMERVDGRNAVYCL